MKYDLLFTKRYLSASQYNITSSVLCSTSRLVYLNISTYCWQMETAWNIFNRNKVLTNWQYWCLVRDREGGPTGDQGSEVTLSSGLDKMPGELRLRQHPIVCTQARRGVTCPPPPGLLVCQIWVFLSNTYVNNPQYKYPRCKVLILM